MKDTIQFCKVDFLYNEDQKVFQSLDLEIPTNNISLVGQNGTGKSTFMLLASGRLYPTNPEGRVSIGGQDSRSLSEGEKQKTASLVYQNMEFENEEPLEELLEIVMNSGFLLEEEKQVLFDQVLEIFELKPLLKKKTAVLSKGGMQRAIMAFSLLYGSQWIFMDEPVFALEEHQKHKSLEFLQHYCQKNNKGLLWSAHELELSQKYSNQCILFYKDKNPLIGKSADLLRKESLEEAFQIPFHLLKQKESLYRSSLQVNTISPETKERNLKQY